MVEVEELLFVIRIYTFHGSLGLRPEVFYFVWSGRYRVRRSKNLVSYPYLRFSRDPGSRFCFIDFGGEGTLGLRLEESTSLSVFVFFTGPWVSILDFASARICLRSIRIVHAQCAIACAMKPVYVSVSEAHSQTHALMLAHS